MKIKGTNKSLLRIFIAWVLVVAAEQSSRAAIDPAVIFGPSDANLIEIYSGMPTYNNYWWDHTDLTVAVSAAHNVDQQKLAAIHAAIETWRTVLSTRFPIVSLTDVTGTVVNPQMADITIHFVPTAGGVRWSGVAHCGIQRCPNVIVRSDLPDRATEADYDAVRVYKTTIHEIGHTLGLGHATPLNESQDLMGYGWINADPDLIPILSDCDLAGIAEVFSWALNGEQPHAAVVPSVMCR